MERPLGKIVALVVALASAWTPGLVRAQGSDRAAVEARKHFDRAFGLLDEGQFAPAILEFQRCYDLKPHHTVLYNIGQAYAQLVKPIEAVEYLQRYLKEGGTAIAAERRAEVETEIARQQTRIATLEIRQDRSWAGGKLEVWIDGAMIAASAKTLRATEMRIEGDEAVASGEILRPTVGIGTHRVRVAAAGFTPAELAVTVVGEDHRIFHVSRGAWKTIEIREPKQPLMTAPVPPESRPPGATVPAGPSVTDSVDEKIARLEIRPYASWLRDAVLTVDRRSTTLGPLGTLVRVPAGEHIIGVAMRGFHQIEFQVSMAEREHRIFEVRTGPDRTLSFVEVEKTGP